MSVIRRNGPVSPELNFWIPQLLAPCVISMNTFYRDACVVVILLAPILAQPGANTPGLTLGTGKKPTEIRTNLDGKQMAALHEYHKYSNMCSNAFTKFNDGPKSVLVTETNFFVMAYCLGGGPENCHAEQVSMEDAMSQEMHSWELLPQPKSFSLDLRFNSNCPIRRQEQVCPETSFLILGLVQILLTSFSRPFESLQYMARKVVEASAGKMIAPF
ncbi:hypothetical protein ACU8KH_03847 [Lachancea thermotolerans]